MARISLDPRRTVWMRLAEWLTKRKYGKVLEPGLALGHHPKVLWAYFAYESKVAKWNELDLGLKTLTEMIVAARIGCTWCTDFGYWLSDRHGLPLEKISKVPAWRDHRDRFTELELLVLEYAEAMTETPPTVTDELAGTLLERLGEPAFVELTVMAATENFRSRINGALGLTSQGFSDSCAIPLRDLDDEPADQPG